MELNRISAQANIGSNLRGFQGVNHNEIGLNAKIASAAQVQPAKISEIEQANQRIGDQLDRLEVQFSGLCAQLRPVLKLDQPSDIEAQGLNQAPWFAASEVGKSALSHAHRIGEMNQKIQELIDLLAV